MKHPYGHRLRTQHGSVFVTVALAIPLMVALVLYVVHAYRMFHERAALQTLADSAAMQAAAIQARGLNTIALTNSALAGIEVVAAAVFLGGHAAGIALDASVVALPEGVEVHHETSDVLSLLRDVANVIAEVQDITFQVTEYAPLLATQLPLVSETFASTTYIIPYPLPEVGETYTLAPPAEVRGIAITNMGKKLADFVGGLAGKAVGKVSNEITSLLNKLVGGTCNAMVQAVFATQAADAVEGVVGEISSWFSDKDEKKKKKSAPISKEAAKSSCKAIASLGTGGLEKLVQGIVADLINASFEAVSAIPGEGFGGFPFPLVLNDNYAAQYQIGVIAVTCRFDKDCDNVGEQASLSNKSYAVSQARAY